MSGKLHKLLNGNGEVPDAQTHHFLKSFVLSSFAEIKYDLHKILDYLMPEHEFKCTGELR
jgi:hypothetical protein